MLVQQLISDSNPSWWNIMPLPKYLRNDFNDKMKIWWYFTRWRAWGDSPVSKALALQTGGFEVNPQNPWKKKKSQAWGWRDDSVARGSYCSPRALSLFSSTDKDMGWLTESPVTPSLRNLTPSSGLLRHCRHVRNSPPPHIDIIKN